MPLKSTQQTLTGKELRFAAENQIPVFYEETYENPQDRHMNFKGVCVMQQANCGYYIGNSDIDPDDYKDDDRVEGEFGEGTFRVCGIVGKNYQT